MQITVPYPPKKSVISKNNIIYYRWCIYWHGYASFLVDFECVDRRLMIILHRILPVCLQTSLIQSSDYEHRTQNGNGDDRERRSHCGGPILSDETLEISAYVCFFVNSSHVSGALVRVTFSNIFLRCSMSS